MNEILPTTFTLSSKEVNIVNEIIDLMNEKECSIREIMRILVFTMSEAILQADAELEEQKKEYIKETIEWIKHIKLK